MNILWFWVIPFAIFGVGLYLANNIEAQEVTIGFTPEDNDKDFQLLQWRFYVLLADIGDGDQFLSNLERERAKEVIKTFDYPVTKKLWCNHKTFGEIYEFQGSYTFEQPVGADKVKQYFKNNLPLDKIRFGEYYLTWNNHHSSNVHPDIIIEHITYGNEAQFLQAELTC